jgi:hypothetical protein
MSRDLIDTLITSAIVDVIRHDSVIDIVLKYLFNMCADFVDMKTPLLTSKEFDLLKYVNDCFFRGDWTEGDFKIKEVYVRIFKEDPRWLKRGDIIDWSTEYVCYSTINTMLIWGGSLIGFGPIFTEPMYPRFVKIPPHYRNLIIQAGTSRFWNTSNLSKIICPNVPINMDLLRFIEIKEYKDLQCCFVHIYRDDRSHKQWCVLHDIKSPINGLHYCRHVDRAYHVNGLKRDYINELKILDTLNEMYPNRVITLIKSFP